MTETIKQSFYRIFCFCTLSLSLINGGTDADIGVSTYSFIFKTNEVVVICAKNQELKSKKKIIDRALLRNLENNKKTPAIPFQFLKYSIIYKSIL